MGTLCAIDKSPVPAEWEKHQTFVEEIAAELSQFYSLEFKQAISLAKERTSEAEAEDLIQVLLSHDWDSLLEAHEQEARFNKVPYSIVVAKADSSFRVDRDLTEMLNKVLGRNNFVVYHGKGLLSMLLVDCNAPKLDAYLSLIKAALNENHVTFHLGSATRSDAHGLNHAYDQALGKVLTLALRKKAA